MMLLLPKPIRMGVLKGKKLINYFFLDVIGDIAPKSIIHLPARSEIDPHAVRGQP